jgi:hypothetical protein
MSDEPVVDLAAARQARWLASRLRRIDRPDGKCFHCEQPADRLPDVGPINVTVSDADPHSIEVTYEFCCWECLAHWAVREAGGSFVTEEPNES